MQVQPWQDKSRIPTLDEAGSLRLKHLLDQSAAPRFRNRSGPLLQAEELLTLDQYTRQELGCVASAQPEDQPWLPGFVEHCLREVPFYRHYSPQYHSQHLAFERIPTICRADLSHDVSAFVPDCLPLERMIAYSTSGTTGHALLIPSHPLVAARYSSFHKKALLWHGVDTDDFDSDLAVMLAGYQESCFTYASLSPYLNDKGLVKLNFHPGDWSHPDDRGAYIDNNRPDLISGDPVSLFELSCLVFRHRPKALLSTSMTLLDSTRELLQQRFNCPLVDIYSLNEAGPVAASLPGETGFKLLQSQLLVEILDSQGNRLPAGQRGEITLTGGFNDYLPLLRYRTGDFAYLQQSDNGWFLCDLEGRPPVRFKTCSGQWLNNVDVTHLLARFSLSQFFLHQTRDGSLVLRYSGAAEAQALQTVLQQRFGFAVSVTPQREADGGKKLIQYSSDLLAQD